MLKTMHVEWLTCPGGVVGEEGVCLLPKARRELGNTRREGKEVQSHTILHQRKV